MEYREIARLAHLFASAALQPGGWLVALGALASATRSGHGELVMIGRARSGVADQSWMSGGEPVDRNAFLAAGGYDPAYNPRVAASLRARVLDVVHEADYDAVAPLLDDDGVRDIFHDGRIDAGCQAALIQDAQLLVGLAVLRGGRDGRTGAEDRALFAAAAPYVRDAAQVHLGLERQGAALMAGAFEAVSAAAFLLDAGGRAMTQTPAAEALLVRGRLRLDDGRLTAPGTPALAAAIAPRLAPDAAPPLPLASVVLPATADAAPLVADVSGLPSRAWSFGAGPRVLVVVRGGGLRRDAATALLRQAWELSAAEAEVVLQLARGRSRAAIAAARGVSVETVRAQLKAIFAKLGVTREAEVAARAAALLGGPPGVP